MKKIKELRCILNELTELTLDDLQDAIYRGEFKSEMYYKGYLACILTLCEYYEIRPLDIDKERILYYIKNVK